ncbi:MAG: hypothetical protein LBQ77_02980 [Treponema sp.]|nr:hypothetical protein [Treponema sp.]
MGTDLLGRPHWGQTSGDRLLGTDLLGTDLIEDRPHRGQTSLGQTSWDRLLGTDLLGQTSWDRPNGDRLFGTDLLGQTSWDRPLRDRPLRQTSLGTDLWGDRPHWGQTFTAQRYGRSLTRTLLNVHNSLYGSISNRTTCSCYSRMHCFSYH